MSGLEKILDDIRQEADTAAGALLQEARKKADAAVDEANADAGNIMEDAKKRALAEAAQTKERAKSSADLKKRQMILAKKQELIGALLEKVKEKLLALPDAEYFAAVKKLVVRSVSGDGKLYFSERDLKRLPAGFEEQLNSELAGRGKLTVADEPRSIDGGVVLSYGGIEENCSFDALFRANAEELQDVVQKILFAGTDSEQ